MKPSMHADVPSQTSGLTLLELLLALFLSALLILGLVKMVAAASAAGDLQRNQAQIQDHLRYAAGLLAREVRQAGYRPEPWNDEFAIDALAAETFNNVSRHGDRLAIRGWSDRNCFDNRNPERDADGYPRFFLRETVFDLNSGGNLTLLCRYGPTTAELLVQIRRQGLVPGVDAFQVLYGEDADGDHNVERWVAAGEWGARQNVIGVQIGLLLASPDTVVEPANGQIAVLDEAMGVPADGRLRRVFEFAVAMRGRTG